MWSEIHLFPFALILINEKKNLPHTEIYTGSWLPINKLINLHVMNKK
jgi:hypothetical protein